MGGGMGERVLILDRDGVINADSDDYIKCLDEWHPLPGSIEAIARLSHAGFRIAIASNQSGVGRGLLPLGELLAMHQRLRELLATLGGRIELIAFCPHAPEDDCPCRKPRPGLLEEIAQRLGTDLTGVPFVGDSPGDILAARAVGAAPWLVRTGKGANTLNAHPELVAGIPVHPDLGAVADALLGGGA